jgi:hypothetical protein
LDANHLIASPALFEGRGRLFGSTRQKCFGEVTQSFVDLGVVAQHGDAGITQFFLGGGQD